MRCFVLAAATVTALSLAVLPTQAGARGGVDLGDIRSDINTRRGDALDDLSRARRDRVPKKSCEKAADDVARERPPQGVRAADCDDAVRPPGVAEKTAPPAR